MSRAMKWFMAAVLLGFAGSGPLYAADRSSSPDSSKAENIGETPQTGDQLTAKKDADVLRGKLVKAGEGLYTLETSPGRQVTIRSGGTTKFEGD